MRDLTPSDIMDVVCEHYSVPLSNMYKKTRTRKGYLFPRQVCIYLIRRHTHMTLKSIGEYFQGDRPTPLDHTTIVHTVKLVKNLMDTDENIKNDLISLRIKLLNKCNS